MVMCYYSKWYGIKSFVKSNLSFEYGNTIFKVELNRFCPRMNHIHGIRSTLSSIQKNCHITKPCNASGLMTRPNGR